MQHPLIPYNFIYSLPPCIVTFINIFLSDFLIAPSALQLVASTVYIFE